MNVSLLKHALAAWLGLFALAFVNGALREALIKRFIEEPNAHHLSAVTGVLIFWGFVHAAWPRIGIRTRREAVHVGALWFALTVLTETFVINRWMGGLSWPEILATYNLAEGQLWPLVLLWVGFCPLVVGTLRKWPNT